MKTSGTRLTRGHGSDEPENKNGEPRDGGNVDKGGVAPWEKGTMACQGMTRQIDSSRNARRAAAPASKRRMLSLELMLTSSPTE